MNKADPAVSVIIATYNYGRYIGDALRSVQAHNAGWSAYHASSTDDTSVVADLIAGDKRFSYVQLTRNVGVSAARNQGLQRAKGEFIQLLDADDVIGPEKLEIHVKALQSDLEISVVYSDLYYFTSVDGPREIVDSHIDKLNGSVSKLLHDDLAMCSAEYRSVSAKCIGPRTCFREQSGTLRLGLFGPNGARGAVRL